MVLGNTRTRVYEYTGTLEHYGIGTLGIGHEPASRDRTHRSMYYTVAVMPECNPSIPIPRLFSHVYYRFMVCPLAQGWPYLGKSGQSGQFLGLVIPHVRPTLFQMFSSGPKSPKGAVGLGTELRGSQVEVGSCEAESLRAASRRWRGRLSWGINKASIIGLLRKRLITNRVKRIASTARKPSWLDLMPRFRRSN